MKIIKIIFLSIIEAIQLAKAHRAKKYRDYI
jgi:hypothetical protein